MRLNFGLTFLGVVAQPVAPRPSRAFVRDLVGVEWRFVLGYRAQLSHTDWTPINGRWFRPRWERVKRRERRGTPVPQSTDAPGTPVGRFGDARGHGNYSAHRDWDCIEPGHGDRAGEPGCPPTIHPATTPWHSGAAFAYGSVSSERCTDPRRRGDRSGPDFGRRLDEGATS